MNRGLRHATRSFVACAAAAVLAACGGGGGSGPGSSALATTAPAGSPQCQPVTPAGATPSAFTIDASPPVAVIIDGVPAGTTPLVRTLAACAPAPGFPSGPPHTVTYAAALPYTVSVAQKFDGNHQIFYNGASDTLGSASVDTTTIAAVRRTPHTLPAAPRRTPLRIAPSGDDVVRDRFYVKERSVAGGGAGDLGEFAPGVRSRIVRVPPGSDFAAAMAAYRGRAGVVEVQPLHVRHLEAAAPLAADDPHFNAIDQWDLFAVQAPAGWAFDLGARATIAFVDTGIDTTLADIAPKVTFAETVLGGVTTPGTAIDRDGHGTNVAGIAGAVTDNAVSVAGTGHDVRLQAYKVVDTGGVADTGDEAVAIRDAVAHGADVISISLGGAAFDAAEHDAVAFAVANGVTVVAAAGNCGDGAGSGCANRAGTLDFPAAYDGVIAVGASALDDRNSNDPSVASEFVPAYSSWGPGLALVAPGGGARGQPTDVPPVLDDDRLHWILNLTSSQSAPAERCARVSDCIGLFVGTSQAAPHVAAAAALIVSALGGRRAVAPARIAQILESTADDVHDPHQGHGRLNVGAALAAVFAAPPPPLVAATTPQFVAFAYTNPGAAVPHIADVNFPAGVAVNADGTFRIADVAPNAGSFRIAVWYDANGNGSIDAGDQFGAAAITCTPSVPCRPGTIAVRRVVGSFALP